MNRKYRRRTLLQHAGAAGAALTHLGLAFGGGARVDQPLPSAETAVIPRSVPEGTVPLVAVEGSAYDCGRQYVEIVHERYPGYRRYLDQLHAWQSVPTGVAGLFEQRAPYILEVFRGMIAADRLRGSTDVPPPRESGCTSFGVCGSLALDGGPISGQTKDTAAGSASRYIVLRMRITQGPTILVLAYPGEVMGYGLWSTGMTLFRNDVSSTGPSTKGLEFQQWGLLALAGRSVDEAAELALRSGITGRGNGLISDAQGQSLSVEFNVGGVSIVPAREGITTHANHPVGPETAPFEDYPDEVEKENSRHRMSHLWRLLHAERGRLTAQKTLMALADHSRYPRGICRHIIDGKRSTCTTAAVVAEPAKGRLHVVRGTPCANWPVTYTL
jgi:hypothetical protein